MKSCVDIRFIYFYNFLKIYNFANKNINYSIFVEHPPYLDPLIFKT